MLSLHSKGNFDKTIRYLNRIKDVNNVVDFNKYGQEGVDALRSTSPVDTRLMAQSWYYTVSKTRNGASISWNNSDIEGGCNVAILVQYGHGTRGGTRVSGVDFINPALKPVFEKIADDLWKEVCRV